jgi:hypothetical protein
VHQINKLIVKNDPPKNQNLPIRLQVENQ